MRGRFAKQMLGHHQESNVVQQCRIMQVEALLSGESEPFGQQQGIMRSAFPMPEMSGNNDLNPSGQAPELEHPYRLKGFLRKLKGVQGEELPTEVPEELRRGRDRYC
jgi:hypothetical protein